MESELETIFSLVVFGVIALIAIFFFFSVIGGWFISYNEEKEEKLRKERYYKEYNEMVITQSKTHHRNYPEDFAKKIKKDTDFEIDFNVSLKDSIVKTEVVYAE
jgi:hypothetical protein